MSNKQNQIFAADMTECVFMYLKQTDHTGATYAQIQVAHDYDLKKIKAAINKLMQNGRVIAKKQYKKRAKIYFALDTFNPPVEKKQKNLNHEKYVGIVALSPIKTHGSLINLPAAKGGLSPKNVNYTPRKVFYHGVGA